MLMTHQPLMTRGIHRYGEVEALTNEQIVQILVVRYGPKPYGRMNLSLKLNSSVI